MKRLFSLLICLILLLSLPLTAHADMGPKPSVNITIENLPAGTVCYGTLLSERESTGPASSYAIAGDTYYGEESQRWVWEVFLNYADPDGYYYLQKHWDCSDGSFRWGYYPPSPFKVLLYFPEYESFAVSGILERYAFDSYYTVDLKDLDIRSVTPGGTADTLIPSERSYDFTWELISLAARIILTVLVELGIAYIFGFRQKKQLKLLVTVNVLTQVLLNVTLNYVNYIDGQMAFTFWLFVLEIGVFVVENLLYRGKLPKVTDGAVSKKRITVYALIANAVSSVLGLKLAQWIPGIF